MEADQGPGLVSQPGGIIGLRDVYDMLVKIDGKVDNIQIVQANHELRIVALERAALAATAKHGQSRLALGAAVASFIAAIIGGVIGWVR